MVKRILLVSLLTLALLSSAGCWNRRDPELLAIVLAVAFDYDEEKEMHLVITQIANPMTMEANGAGGSAGLEQRPFWVVSAHGHTPFEAMRNITTGSSRELFWAHNRVILFSEKTARRGIQEIMDVMERERQIRVIARPAVVQGDIRALMEAEFPLEETGAQGMDRQMVTIQLDKSVFHTKHLNETFSALEAPGQEVVMGKIEVMAEGQQEQQAGEQSDEIENNSGIGGNSSSGSPPPAKLAGAALFRGDKMVGWATQNQSEGWLLAAGRGGRFSFVLKCPDNPQHYFSAEIFHSIARMEPAVEKGVPRMIIKVEATSRIQNYTCGGDLRRENPLIFSLERRVAQAVRNRIKDIIERSQELNADVMGFGNQFYRKHPAFWWEIEDRWDEIFPTLAVDVQVEIEIMRTGLVGNPVHSE